MWLISLSVTVEITHEIAQSFNLKKPVGALVSQVIAGSPAEKAGFKAGDVIISFNKKTILDSSDLPPLVGRVPVGATAKVHILRNGRKKTLTVTIEQLPSEDKPIAAAQTKPASSNKMGVEVIDLDADSMAALGRGVLVRKVLPGSAAEQSGLKSGDVLLQIDRKNYAIKSD